MAHVFYSIKQGVGVDLPADFGTAAAATVTVRTEGVDIADPIHLYAQLYESDETTPLSDEVLASTETGDDGLANHTVLFTGLNTTANKATWDAAKVRYRWSSV